jgi:hypothetical protein
MQRQFRQDKTTSTAAKIVLVVGCLLVLACALIYQFWDDNTPPPRVQKPLPAPVAAVENGAEVKVTPVSADAVVEEQGQGSEYLNVSAGNLQEVTVLRADLEAQNLRVAIAEQESKLKKLQESSLPQISPVVTVPSGVVSALADLSSSSAPSAASPLTVIGVQGIGGNVVAIVDVGTGLRTLKVGDAFGNGRVERISLAGVQVRESEHIRLIPVEE